MTLPAENVAGAYDMLGRWRPFGFCAVCGYPRTEDGACVDEPAHQAVKSVFPPEATEEAT